MNEDTMKNLYYSLLSLLWTGAFLPMIYIQYNKDNIKGVIFNSAILSGSLKSSGSLITDLIFNDMRRYYLYYFDDINAFEKRSLSIGLLENLGDSFIPTYIDDGAINSFANQQEPCMKNYLIWEYIMNSTL